MSVDRSKVLSAAQKHLAKGNYDRAIAEYRRLVDDDPGDVRTWLKIGDLQTRKGAHQDASDTYHRVAEHYAEQGFFLKAVAVYKQILKLQPGRLDVSLRLAEMYEQLQLVSDALQTYEQAAAAYARKGDAENMLAILDRMAKLDPDNIPVRIKYAEALSKAKETARAASEFEAGARLLEEQGRIDDYLKVAERLFYHRPGDVALAKKLARTYLQRNDAKRALSKLQVCFKKDPRDVPTLELLAEAFHVLGQTPKTISVYQEMARILAEKKEPEEQRRILEKILELDPGNADAKQALAKLAPAKPKAKPVESVPPGAVVGVRSQPPPGMEDDDEPELVVGEEEEDDDDEELFIVDDDASDIDLVETPSRGPDSITRTGDLPSPDSEERASLPPEVAREAKIARLLTECEVFERYGLQEKVAKQLEQVVELAPDHIEARERLKEALIKLGRNAEAAVQLRALAELVPDQPQIVELYLKQAGELDEASGETTGDDLDIDIDDGLAIEVEAPVSADRFERMRESERATASDAMATPVPEGTDEAVAAAEPLEALTPIPAEAPATEPPPAGEVAEVGTGELELVDEDEIPTGTIDATSVAPAPEGFLDASRDSIEELDPDELMELDEDMLEPLSEAPPAPDVTPPPAPPPQAPRADITPPPAPRPEPPISAFDQAVSSPAQSVAEETLGEAPVEAAEAHAEEPAHSEAIVPEEPEAPLAPISVQEFEAAPLDPNQGHVEAARERISMPPGEVEETLDEVEFFIAQGLWDAAAATLEDALESHPGNPLLMEKLQEVHDTRASLVAPVEGPSADEDDDAFALAEKLAGELGPMEVEGEGSDVIDVESVFEQFKKGVEEQVGLEDTDTHFDLGIAYKEMGLLDDSIKEFQLAMSNPQRECLCHTMIGLCRIEQGNVVDAISDFKKGLYAEQKSDREELGLYFELGSAYEMLQDPQEALYYYQKVQKRDPGFRAVEDRIQRLTRPSAAPQAEHEPLVLDEVDQAFDDLLGDD